VTVAFQPVEGEDYSIYHASGIYGLRVKGTTEIRYVGQSRDLYSRYGDHRRECLKDYSRNIPVYKWMRKHGPEKIEMVLIELVEPSRLNEREIYWIDMLGTLIGSGRGLNCTVGGDSFPGTTHWNLGRTTPPETRSKISAALRGRPGRRTGKLNMDKARSIRAAHKSGATSSDLAILYNVSAATINRVVAETIWKEEHHDNRTSV
jgi:group I intron endonuclease